MCNLSSVVIRDKQEHYAYVLHPKVYGIPFSLIILLFYRLRM